MVKDRTDAEVFNTCVAIPEVTECKTYDVNTSLGEVVDGKTYDHNYIPGLSNLQCIECNDDFYLE